MSWYSRYAQSSLARSHSFVAVDLDLDLEVEIGVETELNLVRDPLRAARPGFRFSKLLDALRLRDIVTLTLWLAILFYTIRAPTPYLFQEACDSADDLQGVAVTT